MATSISFNTNDLQTSSIITAKIAHSSLPTKSLSSYALAHSNRSKVVDEDYPNRIIRVTGKLVAASIATYDALEDTFKGYFRGKEKNLDIGHAGGTRRYVATVNSLEIDRPDGLAYSNYAIEFLCSVPFGMDTSTTTALDAENRTLQNYTDSYTFLGTADSQQPTITYTLDSVTGGTAQSVMFSNGDTGQQITVTRNWAAADVLVINVFNKTVTVNGTEVAFTGAFPDFEPGSRDIEYADTFTTRTFDVEVTYTKLYL